jgi:hypothetical protein
MCSVPLAFRNGQCIPGSSLPEGYRDKSVGMRCASGGGPAGSNGAASARAGGQEVLLLTLVLGFFGAMLVALLARGD